MPHTMQKARQETLAKSSTDGLPKVRLNLYIPAKDTTDIVQQWEREASSFSSCGHSNIVARPYTSKDTQPLDQTYPLRAQNGSKNYNPAPWEEKTINIVRLTNVKTVEDVAGKETR